MTVALIRIANIKLWVGNRVQLLDGRESRKGRSAVHHLVQDAPERPHITRPPEPHAHSTVVVARLTRVTPRVVIVTPEGVLRRVRCDGFGRHVIDRSNLRLPVDVRRIVRERLGDPKIDQFQVAFDEDEVGRLEVPVDDPVVVDVIHGFEHFLPDHAGEEGVEEFHVGGQGATGGRVGAWT